MADVYKIGVSIALANGVSAVLAVIQKDLLGLNKAVNMTNGSLNRMKLAVGGLAAVGLGVAMIDGVMKFEKAGERYIHQLEMMKTAGFDLAEQQQSIATANRVASSVMTTSPAHNLENIRELVGALNSAGASPKAAVAEANEYLEIVQKADAVMKTTAGGRAMSSGGGVYEMVKALEEIGATRSPERFQRLLGGMVQASEAFGGKINASDWFQTLKYTRGAGQFYSDDFITHYLPTLIQEMKAGGGTGAGGGPGSALASLFQAVVGNTFSIKTRDLGIKLGMIDPSKSTLDRHGRIHNQPGAWFGADVAALNPALFAQQFLIPKLSAQMGGHMMDRTADGSQFLHVKEMATTLATLFGNRTAQQMVGLLLNVQKMEGDKKLVERAMELNAAFSELEKHDPKMIRDALKAQWERVSEDLGKAFAAPVFIEGMYEVAKGLRYLAETLEAHPIITQWVLGFIAALGGLFVVLGTLAIGAAALSAIGGLAVGATIAGILALGAALAWLIMGNNWGRAGEALSQFGAVLARGWDRIIEGLPKGWAKFSALMGHGFDVMLEALPRGWARFSALMERGWDQIVERLSPLLANVRNAVVEGVRTMYARVSDAVLEQLGKISAAIMSWINEIPGIAAKVGAALAKISSEILGWVASLPGKLGQAALDAVGIRPAAPGTESHPNGVPTPGPVFGPQNKGNPSEAPRVHGSYVPPPPANHNMTFLANITLDGKQIAANVEGRLVRSGSGPSGGSTGFDQRTVYSGGMAA